MPLALAEFLISKLTEEDAIVLDPMVGSGTTLVAAKRLQRSALGVDRDPLASLVARVVSRTYNREDLGRVGKKILNRAERLAVRETGVFRAFMDGLPSEDREFLEYWFPRRCQRELCLIAEAIRREGDLTLRDIAWVVFSGLIIAKPAGVSYAMDISRSRPHKRLGRPVLAPFDAWDSRFQAAVNRLPFLDSPRNLPEPVVSIGDARSLELGHGTIDFVLTSPPYLNAIDYLRSHKFTLIWMGHELNSLRELRGTMMGTERGLPSPDGLPSGLEQRLTAKIADRRRRGIVRRYLSDLNNMVGQIAMVLRKDGVAILVLGPTIINEVRTDAAQALAEIAERHGLYLVGTVVRQLNSARRSLPPPASVDKANDMAARMRREVLVALRKRTKK